MRARSKRGPWLHGLARALCALAASGPVLAQELPRHHVTLALPAAARTLSVYLEPREGTLVLHLQPHSGTEPERLLDARSGQPWSGDLPALMARGQHLPLEPATEVQAGKAWDQRLAARLGCDGPRTYCTSPADADNVLVLQDDPKGPLTVEVVDLRGLRRRMDALMAGTLDADEVTREERQWAILQLDAQSPASRQRWLEALRTIDDPAAWRRLTAAARSGPRLLDWAPLRPESTGPAPLDLAAELERAGLRLQVARSARAVLADARADAAGALADALQLALQPGFRADLPSALVDVLLQFDEPARRRLAATLDAEAVRRRHHGLWCVPRWMQQQPCGATPPWAADAADANAAAPSTPRGVEPEGARTAPGPEGARTAPVRRPPARGAPGQGPASDTLPGHTAEPDAGPLEWARIQAQPSQLPLLAYEETTGQLVPEAGTAASGLSFVARTLGPVQQGRFEVQVSPHQRAPLRLQHGAYRVKVRLVLDYAREDRCASGLRCLFDGTARHARTERRDLVFVLEPGNGFLQRQRADFGQLLPLVADGGRRYSSALVQARLAVESVRFDLR